jgi:crotonobetainyl-CoA:carnitine CoA-transferase CaiB-like acyl-CoA transferase
VQNFRPGAARRAGLDAEAPPNLGPLEMLNLPIGVSASPVRISGVSPEFGQHAGQILVDELGYGWDEIDQLRRDAVI